MSERKPYPIRKGTLRDLGFKQWFIALRGESAHQKFIATIGLPPTEQAFIFKTTTTTIHKWRRAHKLEDGQ